MAYLELRKFEKLTTSFDVFFNHESAGYDIVQVSSASWYTPAPGTPISRAVTPGNAPTFMKLDGSTMTQWQMAYMELVHPSKLDEIVRAGTILN